MLIAFHTISPILYKFNTELQKKVTEYHLDNESKECQFRNHNSYSESKTCGTQKLRYLNYHKIKQEQRK